MKKIASNGNYQRIIDDLEVFLNSRGLRKEAQELRKLAGLPVWLTWKVGAGIVSLLGGSGLFFDYYGNHTDLYERCGADPDGTAHDAMTNFVEYAMTQDVVNGIGSFPAGQPKVKKDRLRRILWNAWRNKSPGNITESWIQDKWADARGSYILNFDDEDYYEETLKAILEHRDGEVEAQRILDAAVAELESQQGSPSTGSQREALARYMIEGYPQQEAINLVKK